MTTTTHHTHEDGHVQHHHHGHPPEMLPEPGAAVILTPPDMNGREIEYRASSAAWEEKHMAVRERRSPGTVRHAAIFGPLPPGLYEFRQRGTEDPTAALAVTVRGGLVATEAWPTTG